MSTPEEPVTRNDIKAKPAALWDYRPLVETEKWRLMMPGGATVTVDITGRSSLSRVLIDLELDGRRYRRTRLETIAADGASIDLEEVRGLRIAKWSVDGLAHTARLETFDGETFTASQPMIDPDPLWPVALHYSIAYALGESPTAAVAEHLGISNNAAAQRVYRARAAGFLPATNPGKAS